MRTSLRERQKGASLLEFTLVGIPIMFVLISVFEISRGMWIYTSLAHAVKEGTRFAIVHGATCSIAPNSCTTNVDDVAAVIRDNGAGLDPNELQIRFNASCTPTVLPCNSQGFNDDKKYITLTTALSTTSQWPPDGVNRRGDIVEIQATYPFRSMISMLFPGGSGAINFGVFNLPASSREQIQF